MLLLSLMGVIAVIGFAGLVLRDNAEDTMSLYCSSECAEGKHFKRKAKVVNMI